MGRVTIFAIHGCPYCIKAKEALKSRDIPYLEINLSTHPDKRSDLLSLADSLTVPQVFFNEDYIGGSVETIALLEKWDQEAESHGTASERYEKEVKAMPDPTDPRLQPSTKDPVKESVAPPRGEEDKIKLPNDQGYVTVLEMTHRLLDTVPLADLNYHGKTYKNSITGRKLSQYLMTEFNLSTKEEALDFGVYLNARKLISHVTDDHKYIDREDLFFRLQPHQSPQILNSYRIWTDRVDPNSLAVLARLSKRLQKIFDRATGNDGNVNLKSAVQDTDYEAFEEEVCELQCVSLEKMDVNTKTAFVINLYNMLIKYAQAKVGVPTKSFERTTFFKGIQVNVGGNLFSFQDLENGILRANALPPYALKRVFSSDDERLKLIVEKVDPRIHFGLNCGARSCPPVKKFTAMDLNEELRIVALAFCEQDDNILLSESTNSMHCNTIFSWYMKDFAPSVKELPMALLNYLKGPKKQLLQSMIEKGSIKVQFNEYDWGSNVIEGRKLNKADLKANKFSLKSIFT